MFDANAFGSKMDRMDKGLDKKLERESIRQDVDFILSHEAESRLHIDDFTETFPQQTTENDTIITESLRKRFEENLDHLPAVDAARIREGKKRADALEVIIAEQGELNNWAGENAFFIRSTEFDDYVNGVDIILEFDVSDNHEKKAKRIALAVDASMNTDIVTVSDKVKRNIKKITGDEKPAQVKYFASSVDDFKGSLNTIIPVVVGLDGDHTNELIKVCAINKRLQQKKDKSEVLKEALKFNLQALKNHPAQIVFYKEIQSQLAFYKNLLTHQDVKNKEIYIREIESMIEIFDGLKEEKKDMPITPYDHDAILDIIEDITMPPR